MKTRKFISPSIEYLPVISSGIVTLIAVLVLLGWLMDIQLLKQITPASVCMNPITAVSFILISIVLWILWCEYDETKTYSRNRIFTAKIFAAIVAFTGLIRLLQYLVGWDVGIDQILFWSKLESVRNELPNRMAPNTAFNFLLSGSAILLMDMDIKQWQWFSRIEILLMTLTAFIAFVGHTVGSPGLYQPLPFIGMAVHTAFSFVVLGIGILAVRPDRGVAAIVSSPYLGGTLSRKILPAGITIILLIGWIRLWGEHLGWYNTEFGLGIMMTASVILITLFTLHTASSLNRSDANRRHAEEHLFQSEMKYRQIIETATEGVWVIDKEGLTTFANRQMADILGRSGGEMIGVPLIEVLGQEGIVAAKEDIGRIRRGEKIQREFCFRRKDGSQIWTLINAAPILDDQEHYAGVLAMFTDVTRRKQLEEQFLQAQKMESVGRLAGGVAHDFNNLLTIISGYCSIVLRGCKENSQMQNDLEGIQKASDRATALTRQLLAFSRKQVFSPKIVNINVIVSELGDMIRRLIGEDIDLTLSLDPQLGNMEVDPNQLEQVIMNLVVNARDAMPEGGTISIETHNVNLDENYVNRHIVGAKPGPYIMLSISDTGMGMDHDTQIHVFEPFFTTKEQGKGTGLGLATVYGIVKQSGGDIWVYSEVGHGTTFRIYFPRVEKSAGVSGKTDVSVKSLNGTETILLVEDEDEVRKVAGRILCKYGYTVVEASNPSEAILLCDQHKDKIALVLTDTVMPGMNGRDLAARLVNSYPKLKVIFMSGYTDVAIVRNGILKSDVHFIEKPFTSEKLVRKIREVLEIS